MKALTDYIHSLGLEGRHLHLARAPDLRRFRGSYSTKRRMPGSSPTGASTSSSTTGAPTAIAAAKDEQTRQDYEKPYALMGDS